MTLPTWMVVEDEPDIYDVLLAMFEIWGIEGVAFVDGAEAVAWIDDVDKGNAASELPELAILDIRLPELSGPEVGARLRKSPRLGKMAIVMITAYRLSPEEEVQIKAQAQADTLMYKPLPPMPELRRILDGIINRRTNVADLTLLPPANPAQGAQSAGTSAVSSGKPSSNSQPSTAPNSASNVPTKTPASPGKSNQRPT